MKQFEKVNLKMKKMLIIFYSALIFFLGFIISIYSDDCECNINANIFDNWNISATGTAGEEGHNTITGYGTYYVIPPGSVPGYAGLYIEPSETATQYFYKVCPGTYTFKVNKIFCGGDCFTIGACSQEEEVSITCGFDNFQIYLDNNKWVKDGNYEAIGVASFCGEDISNIISWKFDNTYLNTGKYAILPDLTDYEGDHVLSATVDSGCQEIRSQSITVHLIASPTPTPTQCPTGDCPCKTGYPIEILTGMKTDVINDIKLKNTGYDLEFTRFYSSAFAKAYVFGNPAGPLGKVGVGWKTNYDYNLTEIFEHLSNYSSSQGVNHVLIQPGASGHIHVTSVTRVSGGSGFSGFISGTPQFKGVKLLFPDGNWYIFKAESTGLQGDHYSYSNVYTLPGKSWTVTQQNDGSYIAYVDNKYYYFDTSGRLTGIKDKAGKGVTLAYGSLQTTITDNTNRQLVVTDNVDQYGNTLIASVTLPDNTSISYVYEYNIMGNYNAFLTYVDRPGNEDAWYEYQGYYYIGYNQYQLGWLNNQKDLRKEKAKEIHYWIDVNLHYTLERDSTYGNDLAQLTYNSNGSTQVTDKNGTRTYYFNQYGAVASINDSEGVESRVYNSNGRLTQIRQKNGTTEDYVYDTSGNVDHVTTTWNDPYYGSRSKTEDYGYDSNGNLTSYADGEIGHLTTYQYDSQGRVTHIITGGKDTSYSYNSVGLVKTINDGENMSKSYTYDAYGNVTQIRNNATGGTETFTYGINAIIGKIETHTGEDGVVKAYTYDTNFPSKIYTITSSLDGESETITYTYDSRGNLDTMQDKMGTVDYTYKTDNSDLLWKEHDREDGEKTYTYDSWRRMTSVQDNAGGSRTYNYDYAGRIGSVIDGNGKGTQYGYDVMGNRTNVMDRTGKNTDYQYDGLSRLRKVTDANNGVTEYDYDKVGNRTLIKDAKQHGTNYATNYHYDEYNRMDKETFADNSYVSYTYSIEGDLKKREVFDTSNTKIKEQTFSYDNGHRLTNDGIYSYSFSCTCGRLGSVSGPNGTESFLYDYKGRVNKTTYGDGTYIENIFNENAKTKTIKMDGGILFVLNLDGEGQASGSGAVVEQIGSASNLLALTRDNMGRVTEMDYPNKDRATTEYDSEGRIKKYKNYYENSLINKFEETLDGEGNKLHEKTNVGTRNYGYDNIYQLTSASYERSQAYTWVYDPAGNRTDSNELGVYRTNYAPNQLNQYELPSYTYDADGNLLADGTHSFTWDLKNRLTGVDSIRYKYDHNDLRVEKTSGSTTTKYFYDGNLLLAEKVGSQIQKIYINDGQGIVGMVRPIYDGSNNLTHYQRLYYLYDSLGSISAVTGEHGLPLQNYTYSPFGTCLNVTNDPINNLQFVGRYGGYLDSDTGLTYFWHRWYDSKDGRWISRDKIGTCGGINVYEYANNRPNTIIDYSGLIGTYGQWCGGGWSGGTIYGTPDFNGPYDDDLDLCCRGHDKDWYDCDKEEEKREKESKCQNKPNKPKGETKEQCKGKANKKFCNCMKSVKYTLDLYKDIYLEGAKAGFCK